MYIARFRTENLEEQSLENHITNVAALAESFGQKVGLRNTLRLIGLLHDMGKYSDNFQFFIQNELQRAKENKEQYLLENRHSGFDHGVYGAKYIYTGNEGLKGEKAIREILALVVGYHHGGLPDCEDMDGKVPLLLRIANQNKLEDFNVVYERFQTEIKEDLRQLFLKSYEEMQQLLWQPKIIKAEDFKFMPNLIIKLMYSMLIDADRLDSMCFEEKKSSDQYIKNKEKIQENWNIYQRYFEDYILKLKKNGQVQIRYQTVNKIRSEISEECLKKADCESGIYKLTVPTGGGKTLASMRFAIQHNKLKQKERIIYVIPYTSIIEQNAEVIRKALHYDCDLLEHHSNVMEDNKEEEYKLMTERWNNDIVFTTMVQFLNTFYYKGTQDMRRLHNLMNSTIIFDEVQTVPVKCMSLFNSTINFLNRVGNCTIVLCTATQPKLNAIKLPVRIANMNHEIIENVGKKFQSLERVEIVNCYRKQRYNIEEAVNFILMKKRQVNSLLVVVNKIITAEQIFDRLKNEENMQVIFLSSHLCPEHRKVVLKELNKILQKRENVICVSTSLIEAGIDISFEAAIRNTTKLDSIAQTAGRVNRNGEREKGYCYVINLDEGSYGTMMEVGTGEKHTFKIFNQFLMNKILNPEVIEEYFNSYFMDEDIKTYFLYPIDKGKKEIYKLLETSSKNISRDNKYKMFFKIMFKTASQKFEVIDQNMRTVIVPYQDGIKIMDEIEKMNIYTTLSEKRIVLEKARKYSVNIPDYIYKKLQDNHAIIQNETTGAYLLGSGYYSLQKGVIQKEDIGGFMQ